MARKGRSVTRKGKKSQRRRTVRRGGAQDEFTNKADIEKQILDINTPYRVITIEFNEKDYDEQSQKQVSDLSDKLKAEGERLKEDIGPKGYATYNIVKNGNSIEFHDYYKKDNKTEKVRKILGDSNFIKVSAL